MAATIPEARNRRFEAKTQRKKAYEEGYTIETYHSRSSQNQRRTDGRIALSSCGNGHLKKARCLNPREGRAAERAKTVAGLRQKYPLKVLLRIIGLPRSTFYYQLAAQSAQDQYTELKETIRAIYRQHNGCYGYRRITASIRNSGCTINHKTVQKLMQRMNLKAIIRQRRYRSYRGEVGKIADNVLNREFSAQKPNQKWVTDVTEFNVNGEKLYLSPVMDLFNGEIVSYRIGRKAWFDLVRDMLSDALCLLGAKEKPVVHSDQGWQYQMAFYQKQLQDKGLIQSMSRKGNCLDNAVIESFFGTLKSECFHTRKYASVDELEATLHEYIRYYNHDRIKLKLKGLSPVQYRIQSLMTA